MKTRKVKCKKCGTQMDVDELFVSQFEQSIRNELQQEFFSRANELHQERQSIDEIVEGKVKTLMLSKQTDAQLKLREREKIIDDLRVKLGDAQQRAEQGSMQLQGEVQELSIIELLSEFHPTDQISQSKKGASGADILHIVKTQSGAECGRIYYESKRTRTWSNQWVSKFKKDNLDAKADILVLVTSALPKHIQRYGIIDGVWICSYQDVKELSLVLRYGLLKLQQVAIVQNGRESKMELLYGYLTSEEFKNVFESILQGFKALQDSHNSEKLRMQRYWKERERSLEQVLSNSVELYSSMRGIAGEAIPEVQLLEYRQAI